MPARKIQAVLSMPASPGNLPNLIVIGAQKCATSSLHYYLSLHPEIFMSHEKELNFFSMQHNWPRGVEWYKANFCGEAKIYGESSPEYTNYPQQPGVAERIAALVPEVKLIYLVRDPIERIISHYVHLYARHLEDRPIDEALQQLENNHYLRRSRYFMQLDQYIGRFPESNLLVITTESLLGQRLATLQRVFQFLGVDDQFDSPRFKTRQHQSSHKRRKTQLGRLIEESFGMRLEKLLPYRARWPVRWLLYWPFSKPIPRPVVSEDIRQKLQIALTPDINRLRAYTGQEFADWSV
jgi:hypothetical protein